MEKLYSFLTNLELVDIQAVEENQAFASVNLNPNITWAKFTLTDDQPNANKQRVPKEEFENLINTGIYMPIKMEFNTHIGEHEGSLPLGTIAHLKVDSNRIKGLAALWNQERPKDVELLRAKYKDGEPLRLSWELAYSKAEVEEDGTEALRGVSLLATTVVGRPAYGDRTSIEALSTANAGKMEEDNKMDYEKIIEDLKKEISDLTEKTQELQSSLDSKASELDTANSELEDLREFKQTIEKDRLEAEKLATIKEKFAEVKIEKDNEYFVSNREMLLSIDEKALDFMLQEMVAGLSTSASKKPSSDGIPPIVSDDLKEFTIKEMAELLRKNK